MEVSFLTAIEKDNCSTPFVHDSDGHQGRRPSLGSRLPLRSSTAKAVNVLFDQNPDSSSEHGLCKRQYQFDELSVPRAVGLTPVVHAEMVFIRPAVEES